MKLEHCEIVSTEVYPATQGIVVVLRGKHQDSHDWHLRSTTTTTTNGIYGKNTVLVSGPFDSHTIQSGDRLWWPADKTWTKCDDGKEINGTKNHHRHSWPFSSELKTWFRKSFPQPMETQFSTFQARESVLFQGNGRSLIRVLYLDFWWYSWTPFCGNNF